MPKMEHDLFISYASEDKQSVVEPLLLALWEHGVFRIWIDDLHIDIGQSIRSAIEAGIQKSAYCVIVLSKIYMKKYWTVRELESALSTQNRLMPIWHNVTKEDVKKFSPILSAVHGANTIDGIESIADRIVSVLDGNRSSFYKKAEKERDERRVFWSMADLYVRSTLQLLSADSEQSMQALSAKTGIDWKDHCREQLGVTDELICMIRSDWSFLSDEEAVIGIIAALKEKSGPVWKPPTEGSAAVYQKISLHKEA